MCDALHDRVGLLRQAPYITLPAGTSERDKTKNAGIDHTKENELHYIRGGKNKEEKNPSATYLPHAAQP